MIERIQKDVFVPMRTPSLNEIKGAHWGHYQKLKKKWLHALGFILGRGNHANLSRYLEVTTYHPSGRFHYDEDNHKGGCKPLIDTLKDLGWIKDDSPNWVSVSYQQRSVHEDGVTEAGTRIRLWQPGARPGLFLCHDCFHKFLMAVPAAVRGGGKVTACGDFRECKCGRASSYFVRVEFWEVSHGKVQKTRSNRKKENAGI